MRNNYRRFTSRFLYLFFLMAGIAVYGQGVPPLVYDMENTGVDCTAPPLPTVNELPIVKPLPDPFMWSDGSGRDTTFEAWTKRRNEIKLEVENYEIGPKPPKPDTMSATYSDGTLTVEITENGETLILTSQIVLPEGEGPFPAIIGMGGPSGSLSAAYFSERNIAMIPFNFGQVMQHTQMRGSEPINKLYPDLTYFGAYAAWSWGVSRLIDGLEMTQDSLPIDLSHLGATGCSFAGKMALFAGAFDERIALTIVQESGGGGGAAWRVMETLDGVEKLSATNSAWFMTSMWDFSGLNTAKLPHDHHELIAMIAPRAAIVLGNPDYQWLGEEAGYISSAAAKLVWDNFGIGDRFGYSIAGGHGHCQLPGFQEPEVLAFIDKFLLGDTTVNTSDIEFHPFDYARPEYWTDWWGSDEPYFPALDRGDADEVWFEAECGDIGPAWNVRLDEEASNESYIVPKDGLNSTSSAPEDEGALVTYTFSVANSGTYYLFGKVNCPNFQQDSYWIKMDDNDFQGIYGIASEGWEWKEFEIFELSAGEHTMTISYREEGAKLDKLCISEFAYPPGALGEPSEEYCTPDTVTYPYSSLETGNLFNGYGLEQNFPNPAIRYTNISFVIPQSTEVSLKVYSLTGEEITELAGSFFPAGTHTLAFNTAGLAEGLYFYVLRADGFLESRKLLVQNE